MYLAKHYIGHNVIGHIHIGQKYFGQTSIGQNDFGQNVVFPFWGPFKHWTPFSFNIWDLICYSRPFSAFGTLFIQRLRPYWLFETIFSIWHHFDGHLRHSLSETLFSIWHTFHSTFETLFVIRDPFQHMRPFSFNIWDLIGYLRPFSAFDTLLADSAAHMLQAW